MFTKPKVTVRQSICTSGCRRQRSLAPVQKVRNLSAEARKLIDAANKLYDDGKFSESAKPARAAGFKPNYEAFLGLGESEYQLKHPDEAVRSYQQALNLNPKLDDARFNIGVIQLKKKAYAEALVSLKAAIDIAPANADEYYYYGLALSQLKRKDEAVTAFRRGDPDRFELLRRFCAARGPLNDAGRHEQAVEVLPRLSLSGPTRATLSFHLAMHFLTIANWTRPPRLTSRRFA